jgi:fatty-acyl-CoA synthase
MTGYPSTVAQLLARSARRFPDRLALTFAGRQWSYAELDAAAGRVAGGLGALGLAHGDRVAAFGKNSDAYLLLYLGCARAGLVHVPVNFNARGDELAYLATQSGPKAIFSDEALAPRLDQVAAQLSGVRRLSLRGAGSEGGDVLDWALDATVATEAETGVTDGDLAQLLYTSGTTARPKGAMMTHRALVHEYVSCLVALGITSDDVLLHALPLYHSAQMHVFLMPGLAVGAANHLVEDPLVDVLFERVAGERITSLFLPPTVWVDVANHPGLDAADLSSLRRCYYGASIMPVPILRRLRARLPEAGFYNCFGQSEIGPLATVLAPEEHDQRPDSVGRSVLFVETRVVDGEMNDVAPGELGEVIYRSPQLCTGYWDKPEETAAAFAGGWFHSGDLVRIDAEGYMYVVDRIKDVVNTGGVLVATREVEDALYSHPAVAEVAVIGLPHPRWIEAVTAIVVARGKVDEDELLAHARERLSAPKLPKAIHFADALPRNASGKLLKRELRKAYGGAESAVGEQGARA